MLTPSGQIQSSLVGHRQILCADDDVDDGDAVDEWNGRQCSFRLWH